MVILLEYKNLILYLDGQFVGENISSVFGFASALNCYLKVLHVIADPRESIPLMGDGMSVSMVEDMVESAVQLGLERKARAKEQFNLGVKESGLQLVDKSGSFLPSVEWVEEGGRYDLTLVKHAKMSDVVFFPLKIDKKDVSQMIALNAVIFGSGRPVIIIPEEKGILPSFQKILVAWNGSKESALAISVALPFLKSAHQIEIFDLRMDARELIELNLVSDYLACHGVKASISDSAIVSQAIGREILKKIRSDHADLLVMGAYTQSRLRRLVLGGATRYVAENAKIPVLMVH